MTLIIAWIAVDSRGPSSLYMMSESRISWSHSNKVIDYWDHGKKVFALKNSPDLIGYCGDVHFPLQVINHIVELAENNILFNSSDLADKKFERIKYKTQELLDLYPEVALSQPFSILYSTRVNKKEFICYLLSWERNKGWFYQKISTVEYSSNVFAFGSGAKEFNEKYIEYQKSSIKRTSRAIYQCFCDTLRSIKDKACGGAPQLVGLYRIKNGINFGIIHNNKRYLSGINVDNLKNFDQIEWRNELFERVDGIDKKILPSAQKQPNPFRKK